MTNRNEMTWAPREASDQPLASAHSDQLHCCPNEGILARLFLQLFECAVITAQLADLSLMGAPGILLILSRYGSFVMCLQAAAEYLLSLIFTTCLTALVLIREPSSLKGKTSSKPKMSSRFETNEDN